MSPLILLRVNFRTIAKDDSIVLLVCRSQVMKNKSSTAKSIIAVLFLFISCTFGIIPNVVAQTPPEPYRESLLNGLKILSWYESNNPKVYVKLRIHSGAAFDPAGEPGTVALLTDMFFPEVEDMKSFFETELDGKLEINIDQDTITISASGNASEYDRIIGVLQSAILTTQINDENVTRLRAKRLAQISEGAKTPSRIADQAVLSRLLAQFPYSRLSTGEVESLPKIDRVDIQFARERILKADNATITIVGGVADKQIMRSLKQRLGSWMKSDKAISQAFSQPDPPAAKTLIIDSGANENAEIRLAVRGLSRADNDYAAAMILAAIAQERLRSSLTTNAFAKHEAHVLPGVFVTGASVPVDKAPQSITNSKQVLSDLSTKEPNATEFEKAKSDILRSFSSQIRDTKTLADFYLDRDTFRIQATPVTTLKAIENLKPNDIQRVAARLFGNATFASVVVGNVTQLKDVMSRNGNAIEISGEKPVLKEDKENPVQGITLKPVGKP